MPNHSLALLVWLPIAAIVVLQLTTPRGRRPLRKKLMIPMCVVWLVTLSFYVSTSSRQHPFFAAVKLKEVDKVEMMLDKDPQLVQARTIMGKTALHIAARSGDTNLVKVLLRRGGDPNAKGGSAPPLHFAAYHGDSSIAAELLNANADVNAIGFRHNDTALHVAASRGHLSFVKLLLERGADVGARNMLRRTAAEVASERGHTNLASFLFSLGS